jgi:hypothetical protein
MAQRPAARFMRVKCPVIEALHDPAHHHWETFNFFFDSYPPNTQFQRSVYYDVKVTPERYFKAYFYLARFSQRSNPNGYSIFQCFPLKTSNYPNYTQVDTLILGCAILGYPRNYTAARLRRLEDKRTLYGELFDMESERFRYHPGTNLRFKVLY